MAHCYGKVESISASLCLPFDIALLLVPQNHIHFPAVCGEQVTYGRPHTSTMTPRLWSGMTFGLSGSVLIASLNRSASSTEENRLYSFSGPAISRTCSTV